MTGTNSTAVQDQRWSRIEALFTAALDTPPDAREPLLASSCTDESVLAEVRRLLARHDSLSDERNPDCRFLNAVDFARATLLCSAEDLDPPRVGRYQIVRRLGSGATGIVYLARDSVLDREVALKLLAPSLSADPHAIRRFSEEARAASALVHPHIATVYEFGRADNERFFIAMAYHQGETLRDRLGRGALPVDEALGVAREICDGLAEAHAKGIVHRDIKPENILLTGRGAVIVDFGIAKVLGHTLTRTGAALGTAAYMSPEQTRGAGVDHRADIWSLGVVLYEMLTGSRPFVTEGGEALVYAIRHDSPVPVRDGCPEVGPGLARIVDRCLQKEPARRYQSSPELLSALRTAAIEPPTTHTVVPPGWRRLGLVVGCAAVAGVALLAAPGRPPSGGTLSQLSTVLPPTPAPGAIAILPVSPVSEELPHEQTEGRQYFTAGIGDALGGEIVRTLSATPGIRVTSRSSVRIAGDTGPDAQALGRRLGVRAVLELKIRARDSLLAVEAQLVQVSDRRELWSQAYERRIEEAATIPLEIRRSVAAALGVEGRDSAEFPVATNDPAAYDLYLRGLFARSKSTPAGLEEAEAFFRGAIARDTGFALAYAQLADVYVGRWIGAPADRFRRVKPLVTKSLELDSNQAFAHRLAGYVAAWQDHDWSRAGWHYGRALALDSSDIWNYHFNASYLAAIGRPGEAVALARAATALDPVSSLTATQVGFYLFLARRYTEAIAVLERAIQVDTTTWQRTPLSLGRAYLAIGRYDDAIKQFRRAGLESSHGFEAPALLAYALGLAGRTGEVRALAAQYVERASGSSARPLDLVAVHLGLGDTAQALDWVERLPDDRGSRFFLPERPDVRSPARLAPVSAGARTAQPVSLCSLTAALDRIRPPYRSSRRAGPWSRSYSFP